MTPKLTPEEQLRSYLISRKVAPIWADGALRNLPFSTNRYFTKSIAVQSLTLGPVCPSLGDRAIKRLVIMAELIHPDADKERPAIFVYTFDRKRKAPHRVEVLHNVTKATFIPA